MRISLRGLCGISVLVFLCLMAGAQNAGSAKRPRAADIGLKVGVLPAGPLDAITDVAGVEVGQATIVRGDDVRTGVTAILPHAGNLYRERVPSGVFVGNGYGKLTGATQVDEMGEIETRILLTVHTPTKYLFADFVNAAMESKPGEMTCYFPMPFQRKARIVLRSASEGLLRTAVDYAVERRSISKETPYFHALYHDTQKTVGYSQYPVLQIQGKGLFVGMNLFDSGHNHGGGDAALIDAGTDHPHVLHGICGEDYFAFAWHRTGTMTPLTGAPVHERRYRLHLENPYPFSESFQFLFGAFAGLQPKSVAFWCQFPTTPKQRQWVGLAAPWKVLGPLGPETPLPSSVSDQSYETTIAINKPTQLTERWQDTQMLSGFLDLTYQFRHYALIESGSGFVAGASRTKLTTYIYSTSEKTVNAILGHDDGVLVLANGVALSDFPGSPGFGPSPLRIPLHVGWNKLELVLSNDENVNWRWSGISLALPHGQNQDQGLRFASEPSPSE